MFDSNSGRPISSNWPLVIGYIFSLIIHWEILTSYHPAKLDAASSSPLQVHLASNSAPYLPETVGEEPTLVQDTVSKKKLGLFNTQTEKQGEKPESIEPIYFPTRLMERPPFPVSAPSPKNYLDKNALPATITRLRLFINANGRVVDIRISYPENIEEKVSRQILDMFYATSFVPGNIRGVDLPCYMDIELDLASYLE